MMQTCTSLSGQTLLQRSTPGKNSLEKGIKSFTSGHLANDDIKARFDKDFKDWLKEVKEAKEFVFFDFGVKKEEKSEESTMFDELFDQSGGC